MIFVTDLWLEDPMLTKVANDEKLNDKFFVFDHHKSALEGDYNKYSFTTIKISDNKGLCSGTSLYYEWLIEKGFLDKNSKTIRDFSELTRRYDAWEWKNKYNDELPHKLTLLFDIVGCYCYINLIYKKLAESGDDEFKFNELEETLINNKIVDVKEKLISYANKVYYKEVLGLKAGIVFIDYEYRNDLVEYFRENDFEMDFVILISLSYGTISYRTIKSGVNVRLIAEKFNGKGHDVAASSPISGEKFDKIIELLTDNN